MEIKHIIIKIFVIIIPVLIAAAFYSVAERKISNKKWIIEFRVPILVLFFSTLSFLIHTNINNPYNINVQILVFIGIFILNTGIFCFFKSERKLSFLFFTVNCLLIYTYLRFSIDTTFPLGFIYYGLIFFSFHVFEGTFTKKFYLRTRIVLTGYSKNSELMKTILWFFLVLVPSLIKHPLIMVTVCQPLLVYCYLFGYNYLLFIFSAVISWCGLLFLMDRYKFGLTFLHKCTLYFSRRACLHYIGNTLGGALA